jgi:septal ring factor EnvC (AmiA/AmiB activator)
MDDLRALDREGVALRKEALDLDASMETRERDVRALEQARVGLAQQQAAQQMFESAFATPGPSPSMGSRINYGLSIIGGSSAASFADQRGSLALPVSGPNRIADASRAESDGPGLELAAHSGAAVRAAASGRVAFADRYGSYGQLVILEHGDRYYTVYGGLSHIEVSVGDDLSKSARLGVAGVDPVYFEVRRGTRTQDARTWLGL